MLQLQQLYSKCSMHLVLLFCTQSTTAVTTTNLHRVPHHALDPYGLQDAFQVCCWVNCSGLSRHPYGDALLVSPAAAAAASQPAAAAA
jgi:hypothetical protein